MKSLVMAAATLALLLSLYVHSHAKQLPPAFGKELVPEKSSQDSTDPSQSEISEEKQEGQERRQRASQPPRRGRGQKLRIQLDGDEDGGGVDEADDGSGDF